MPTSFATLGSSIRPNPVSPPQVAFKFSYSLGILCSFTLYLLYLLLEIRVCYYICAFRTSFLFYLAYTNPLLSTQSFSASACPQIKYVSLYVKFGLHTFNYMEMYQIIYIE